jgi:UDP-N-acetylmuramyl tripeptide synthase
MKWLAQHVADDLQAAGRCVVHGALGNVVFDGVATDSRQAVQGMLFVALHGDRFDAHAFVVEAVQQGARGVVVDLRRRNLRRRSLRHQHLRPRIHRPNTTMDSDNDPPDQIGLPRLELRHSLPRRTRLILRNQ